MNWSQLPARYRGAEIGAALGMTASIVTYLSLGEGRLEQEMFNGALLGAYFGYLGGSIFGFEKWVNKNCRSIDCPEYDQHSEGKLETSVSKTEDGTES